MFNIKFACYYCAGVIIINTKIKFMESILKYKFEDPGTCNKEKIKLAEW